LVEMFRIQTRYSQHAPENPQESAVRSENVNPSELY